MGAQGQPRPVPHPARRLAPCTQGSHAFLGFTLANLMASLSLSRALWKYATCGDSGESLVLPCLESPPSTP